MVRFDLVIFDCDGVLVDSEVITNQVYVDMLVELGVTITLEDMFERFVGHSMAHNLEIVREIVGRDVPLDFEPEFRKRSEQALAAVQAVAGAAGVLEALAIPCCVASNGAHEKMRRTLGRSGLLPWVDGRLFSATQVAKGKPAPDVFLLAAREMGARAERVAVVEDTPVGVTAGRAAGMTVFGYAERIPAARLKAAGAHATFSEMPALLALLT